MVTLYIEFQMALARVACQTMTSQGLMPSTRNQSSVLTAGGALDVPESCNQPKGACV